jgi:hypothetical protein
MDFLTNCRKENNRTFVEFYLAVLYKNIVTLKDNLEKVFSFEIDFNNNLWHNFACNFRDQSFSEIIVESNDIWSAFIRVVETINTTLETIYQNSTIIIYNKST